MASLRRLASLDTISTLCSSPAACTSRLMRHSSLPNLIFGDRELSLKALCMAAMISCSFPCSIELHSQNLRSRLPLCRARSTHSFDELPYFDIPGGHFDLCAESSHGVRKSPRKDALLAVGKQSLDLEKSIVYSELKESMWKLEAPARFLRPSDSEANSSSTSTTLIYESSKPVKNPNLSMESSQIGVKGRPLSLRMLKRKLSRGAAADCKMNPCGPSSRSRQLHPKSPSRSESNHDSKPQIFLDTYDSVSSAFAALFFIHKVLHQHSHSLRIRSQLSVFKSGGSCYENLVGRAWVEMLDSFLWLFQQVFSCTPELMLLTMVLLADFTLHSMSMHVALPVRRMGEPPTPLRFPLNIRGSATPEAAATDGKTDYHHGPEERRKVWYAPSKRTEELLHRTHVGADEIGSNARTPYGDGDADDPHVLWPKTTGKGGAIGYGDNTHGASSLLWNVFEKQSEFSSDLKEINCNVPMKLLVAPVCAPTLEADDYPCFDRTDLTYQHEIIMDPSNPLLLANYAQFLHLVRHDYSRAEQLYKRAVRAETEVDGEVMGRFASFLWVAKGDVAEAEKAFKAAIAVDPANAYHAGNYAHFLWTSNAGQA